MKSWGYNSVLSNMVNIYPSVIYPENGRKAMKVKITKQMECVKKYF